MLDFRLDRTLSVNVVRPLGRLRREGAAQRIPILMYHGIRDEVGIAHPYYETRTTPRRFALQMRYLRDAGYSSISLATALHELATGTLPRKAVVITFDDAFSDFYHAAFPVLAAYGLSATVFIVSEFARIASGSARETGYMRWPQIREVHAHGICMGSHTMTHPDLRRLTPQQIDTEVGQSKRDIEEELGQAVQSFSFPNAFPEQDRDFTKRMSDTLHTAGYKNAVSTILGRASRASNCLCLPRLPVNTHDDLALFKAKLEGAYDWLHVVQAARKRLLGTTR
jgi:peptidoglycan/xylan/chitin deacetylase (PgdA/CDA1 family)